MPEKGIKVYFCRKRVTPNMLRPLTGEEVQYTIYRYNMSIIICPFTGYGGDDNFAPHCLTLYTA